MYKTINPLRRIKTTNPLFIRDLFSKGFGSILSFAPLRA